MVRLLLVNNYSDSDRERALRLRSSLERNGSTVGMVNWDSLAQSAWREFDGVILSGSYYMLSEPRVQAKFSRELESIRACTVPLLGVCFGHQLLGHAFGSAVVRMPRLSTGYRELQVLRRDTLFDGLAPRVWVYESHHEVVSSLPKGFIQLGRSRASEVCAMRHSRLPLFGVQFHPERNTPDKPDGERVISNYVRAVKTGL